MQIPEEIEGSVELPAADRTPQPPDPDRPVWGPLTGFAVWLASVGLVLFMPMLFVLPYASGQQVSLADSEALGRFIQSDKTAIILNVLSVIPAHALTLLLAWFVVTQAGRRPFFEALGTKSGGFGAVHGAAIIVGFFGLAIVVGHFFPEQDNEMMKVLRSSREATVLVAIIATFSAPFVEEVVYRGVLYSGFRKSFGEGFSVLLVTLLFTLVHVPQYWPTFSTIALLLLLSLVLTVVRARTGNLMPCIILHFVFNGIQSSVLLFAE